MNLDEPCFIVLDEMGLFILLTCNEYYITENRLRRQDRQIRARLQKLWGRKI